MTFDIYSYFMVFHNKRLNTYEIWVWLIYDFGHSIMGHEGLDRFWFCTLKVLNIIIVQTGCEQILYLPFSLLQEF